jgi:hypothetical protein
MVIQRVHCGAAYLVPFLQVAGLEIVGEENSRVFLDADIVGVSGGKAFGGECE